MAKPHHMGTTRTGVTSLDKLKLTDCTPEQIEKLNRYQRAGSFHPFTCGNRSDPGHESDREGILLATPEGWRCPTCDYRQNWAHPFMATEAASQPFTWPGASPDREAPAS